MDIIAPDIAVVLLAGVLLSLGAVVPLVIFRSIRTALRKPRPTSAEMSRKEFCTSGRQAEPRGVFDEGCYRALLREVTKKRKNTDIEYPRGFPGDR